MFFENQYKVVYISVYRTRNLGAVPNSETLCDISVIWFVKSEHWSLPVHSLRVKRYETLIYSKDIIMKV